MFWGSNPLHSRQLDENPGLPDAIELLAFKTVHLVNHLLNSLATLSFKVAIGEHLPLYTHL